MIEERKKNFEIVVISNRYKDTLDDFIDSSNLKSPLRPVDKRLRNGPRFKGSSTGLLEEDCLDEDVLALDRSS